MVSRIKSLKDIVAIAQTMFKDKPTVDQTWRIITGIMIFVGLLTAIHFAVWGKRSKGIRSEELPEVTEKEGEQQPKK